MSKNTVTLITGKILMHSQIKKITVTVEENHNHLQIVCFT